MFTNKMETESIPERVFLIYSIVKDKPIKSDELRKRLMPSGNTSDYSYYSASRRCAEELALITNSDDCLYANSELDAIDDIWAFRRYINNILENYKEGHFYKATSAFFSMNINDSKKNTKSDQWSAILTKEISKSDEEHVINIDGKEVNAWKFWVSFLGFAVVNNITFLPNAAPFIEDLICESDMQVDETYTVSEFIDKLKPKVDIILGDVSSKVLNYGTSCGLRTLHDLKFIEIVRGLDQGDIWSLYKMDNHVISSTINRIKIVKKERL